MTDTTPMIDWFEAHHPDHPVIPEDPLQGLVSRMLEDYAEEWLWRPAMHFRWHYPADAALVSREVADEILRDVPLPKILLRAGFRFRQRTFYLGVSIEHVAVGRRSDAAWTPLEQGDPQEVFQPFQAHTEAGRGTVFGCRV